MVDAMLRVFGPSCPPAPIDAGQCAALPAAAVWIDLLEPTEEEERLAEAVLGANIPTRDEMVEIEPSSRLYEKGGVMFLTMGVLFGVDEKEPSSDPISFIISDQHLVTVRYIDPKPFVVFGDHAYADPSLTVSPLGTLMRLLDAIIDRLADELENSGREIEKVSGHVFQRQRSGSDRISTDRLEALIMRIGSVQRLLSRVRETGVGAIRLLTFLDSCDRVRADEGAHRHVQSLVADAQALADHSTFLADNLTFLLDASLGLIGIEQNVVMKIFSIVAVVLMPPTLVAGIYGMNFEHMPELKWDIGYPMAVVIMLLSAIIPYLLARRRGWL